MNKPTVDILMATYNGEQYVGKQIESIQRQSFQNWRLLVSDDCSTDNTLDVVKSYSDADPRIQVVSSDVRHGGAKENFFFLLHAVSSQYVMFCDQDDSWLPNKVEFELNKMRELEAGSADQALMVFTDMKVVDSHLQTISESFERYSDIDPSRTKFSNVLAQSVGAGCTMLINKKAVDYALSVQKLDQIIMHDWWITLICSAFGKIAYIDKATSLYRQHGKNEVGARAYSPIERASHLDEMRKSVADTIVQASYFYQEYGTELSANQSRTITEFCAIAEVPGILALRHLFRSGCWKKGLRKIGQVLVAVYGVDDVIVQIS